MIRTPRDNRINKGRDSSSRKALVHCGGGNQSWPFLFCGGLCYEKEVQDREREAVTGLWGKRGIMGLGGLGLHCGLDHAACGTGLNNLSTNH